MTANNPVTLFFRKLAMYHGAVIQSSNLTVNSNTHALRVLANHITMDPEVLLNEIQWIGSANKRLKVQHEFRDGTLTLQVVGPTDNQGKKPHLQSSHDYLQSLIKKQEKRRAE